MAERENRGNDYAVLGGGCFWCLEAVFRRIPGVIEVTNGYAGGTAENPSYEAVCTGDTGHAEVVRVEFDPQQISFGEILEHFFRAHDPTTLNRQGADVGSQYRSVILYRGEEQRRTAEEVIRRLEEQKAFKDPIVTEIAPLGEFYRAEAYHQRYFEKNPFAGYCSFVIRPKLKKLSLSTRAVKAER
jgi:peptide-methionine (S)-S-oxide reductase